MRARLISRPLRWLRDNDPCYVEVARVVHIGLGLALGIAAGVAVDDAYDLGQPVAVPLFVALGAMAHLTFLAPSSRTGELVEMGRISALTLGFILLSALIGPGSLPQGPAIMKLLLVPTTFVALYIRRFGLAYHRAGLALFVTALIVSTIEPTRAQGWVLLLAATGGAAMAYLLRLSPLRPSAVHGLRMVLADYRRVLVAVLTNLAGELEADAPVTRQLRGVVPRIRRRARAAAIAATAELPQQQAAFDAVRTTVYRLQLAVAFLLEAAPDPGAAGDARLQLALAVKAVRNRIAMGETPDLADRRVHDALALLNDAAFDAPLADELQRYNLLRAAAALARVLAATIELNRALQMDAPPPAPAVTARADASKPARPGLLPTTRVAVQGLVATAVTTALDFGLHLDHAYWATLTVMLVIGSSFGETALRARHRTIGTGVGALLGIVLAALLGGEPWVLAGLCILGQMLGALTAQRRYEISAAAIGFSVVVGLHLLGGFGPADMVARIYETGIGAAVALAASRLVLPVYGGDQARQQIGTILARCRTAFAAWWPRLPGERAPESSVALVRDLILLEERLPQYNAEAVLGRRNAVEVVRLSSFLRVLQSYLLLVEQAAARLAEVGDLGPAEPVLASFRADVLAAFDDADIGGPVPPVDNVRVMVRRAAAGMAELRQQGSPRSALLALVEYTFYGEALARALQGLGDAVAGRPPADEAPPTS